MSNRRTNHVLFLASVVVGVLASGLPIAVAAGGQVHARLGPRSALLSESALIPLSAPEGGQSASTQIFLSATGGAVPHATLQASVRGPSGLISATFSPTQVAVPTDPQALPVTITVAGLVKPGRYTGALLAVSGGAATQLASLVVTKAPDPTLVVDGIGSDGKLLINSAAEQLSAPVTVRSSTATTLRNVRLELSGAVDSQGVTHPLQFASGGATSVVDVAGNGTQTVMITGLAPVGGDYTATLTVVYKQSATVVPLTVHRIRNAPPVSIDDVSTPSASIDWPWSTFGFDLRVLVRETDGIGVTLQKPQLLALLRDERGISLSGGLAAPQILDDTQHPLGEVTLAANESRVILIRVTGIRPAGKYTGTIRLSAADGPPVDKPWTVYLHWSPLLAGLLIALGALAAAVLRYFLLPDAARRRRQMLAARLRRRLAEIRSQFAPLHKEESEVLVGLDRGIAEVSAFDGTTADLWNRMLVVFGRFLTVSRMVADSGKPLPGDAAKAFHQARATLLKAVVTAETVATAEQEIDVAVVGAERAFRKTLRDNIGMLETSARAMAQHAQGDTQTRLHGIAEAAKVLGEQAEGQADLRQVAGDYAQLRQRLVGELDHQLTSVAERATAPAGVTDTEWTSCRSQIRTLLDRAHSLGADSAQAIEVMDAAEQVYAATLVSGIANAQTRAGSDPEVTATQRQAIAKLGAHVHREHVAFTNGLSAVVDLGSRRTLTALGKAADAPAPHEIGELPPVRLPAQLRTPAPYVPSALPHGAAANPNRLLALWLAETALAWAVITLFAALLGITVLWSESWGGYWDGILATLWGAGLYQVSAGTAFGGLAAMRDQIAGAPPAPAAPADK